MTKLKGLWWVQRKQRAYEAGAAACREGKGPSYNPYIRPYGDPEQQALGHEWLAGYKKEDHKYD